MPDGRVTLWMRARPWLAPPVVTIVLTALLIGHLFALPRRESGVGCLMHAIMDGLGFGPARSTHGAGGWSDCVLSKDNAGRWQASEGFDIPPGGYGLNFKVSHYRWGVFAPTSLVTSRILMVYDSQYSMAALPPASVPVARAWIDNDVGAGPAFDLAMAGVPATSTPIGAGWVQNGVLAAQFGAMAVCAVAWATCPKLKPEHFPERCSGCGYSTHGLARNQCPECGEEQWVARAAVERSVRPRRRP